MASKSNSNSSNLWDDDFGQKVDLCRRIREILTNYPEGIAVLKELVQNADDAGATTIRFVYDTRKHPTDGLAEANLAQFQSPAILIYNNAVFTESDFNSIQSIGSSISKKDKVNKTGRFGLGFNAVYHISELPAFVSSEYLIYFDPQCKYLPNINPGNPGKRINFVKQQIIKKYPNQFIPFRMFDNDMLTRFEGTLFRLPLRTKTQSKKSQLSSKFYSDDDMKLMYDSLINEGDNFLLFLKSIQNLEYYEWSDMNKKEPTLLYKVRIAQNLSKQQHELRNYITTIQKPDASLSWIKCNNFKFETILFDKSKQQTQKLYHSEWIICNALGGGSGQCSQIAANPGNKHMKLLPYGGIAARIYSNVPWQIKGDNEEKENNENNNKKQKKKKKNQIIRPKGSLIGRAYCFLSLPLKNGLPVHCNGYFELSSNRRDLWWGSGDDMTGSGSLRYFWNMTLIQDVIARCYIETLNFAKTMVIEKKISINTFYELWPYQIPGNEGDPFEILTSEILSIISNRHSFLYSEQNNGQWLKCSDSVISANQIKEDKMISSVLLNIGLPIVELPSYQSNVLQKAARPPTILSSKYVRDWMRQRIVTMLMTQKRTKGDVLSVINGLNEKNKILLIEYLLNDLSNLSTQQLMIKKDFPECLHCLPILPTAESELKLFWCHDQMEADIVQQMFGSDVWTKSVFYSDDKQCVDILSHTKNAKIYPLLVQSNKLSEAILRVFNHNNCQHPATNLFDIRQNGAKFCELLKIVFEENKATFINNKRFKNDGNIISNDLIDEIWHYLTKKQIEFKYYKSMPIVPAKQSDGVSVLCLPHSHSWILDQSFAESDKLIYELFIDHSQCVVLDSSLKHISIDILKKHQCIFTCSIEDILRLLSVLPSTVFVSWQQNIEKISEHLRALRHFLISHRKWNVNNTSTEVKKLLQSLPIYDVYSDDATDENPILSDLKSTKKYIAPPNTHRALLSSQFIFFENDNNELQESYTQFLKVLAVRNMDFDRFYDEHYFKKINSFNEDVRNLTMMEILKIIKHSDNARALIEIVKAKTCIPSSNGTLKRISNLYDPTINAFKLILDPNKHFPHPSFCKSNDILSILRQLGLNTALDRQAIILSATSIANSASKILNEAKEEKEQKKDNDKDKDADDMDIESDNDSEHELHSITKRAKSLLKYLDNHWDVISASSKEHDWNLLKQHKWLPIIHNFNIFAKTTRDTHPCLPYKPLKHSNVHRFASCDEIRIISLSSLCSSQFYILNMNLHNESLKKLLGVNEVPNPPQIAKQIVAISANYQKLSEKSEQRLSFQEWLVSTLPLLYRTITHKLFDDVNKAMSLSPPGSSSASSSTGSSPSRKSKNSKSPSPSFFSSALNFISKSTENAVNSAVATITYDAEAEKRRIESLKKEQIIYREQVKNIFDRHGVRWIWVNGYFHDSSFVAFRHPSQDSINCSPYLEIISSAYRSFQKLFIFCGVRDQFEARDYGNILNLIAAKQKESKNDNADINASDINLAVNVCQYLSDRMNQIGDLLFPIPCADGSMKYANDIYYNDAPWINRKKNKNVQFVHPKLSIQVCKKLGVNSFRELFVSKNSQSLSFEFNSNQLSGTKAFGQHESLTRRLKDILRAYPEGPSIIYEFIQNADDAKATKVIILLNEKEYKTDSLLSTELKQFQGPNLMIYNDSKFTDKDFINLSRIGQGSKLQKLEATGRFGLGFNCCYHLTDVPSLVSSDSIVFFDPHTSHLPNANSNAPGIRINFLQSDLINTFPDQFKPFQDYENIFNCSLDEEFNGTLFRFPLRNESVAKNSEIKSEICQTENVKKIIYEFAEFAKETLLFLRYVCSIQLMIADKNGKVKNVLNVEVKDKGQRSQSVWRSFIEKGISATSASAVKTAKAKTQKKVVSTATSTDKFYRYLQRLNQTKLPIGIRSIKIISNDYRIQNAQNDNDENKDDEFQVANTVCDEFVICEKIGGGETVNIACKKENRDLKLIPFGCVAAHISSSDQLEFNVLKGRAFTFLPLPISTGLPIHINSYFELSANRRDLWWGLDMHGVGAQRHKWNESILRDILAPSYCNLMAFIAKKYGESLPNIIHKYYNLFPGNQVNGAPFQEFVQSFYSNIAQLNVLYSPLNDGQWLSPSKCIAFSDETETKSNENDADSEDNAKLIKIRRIRSILLKCEISVVTLKQFLIDQMTKHKSGLAQFSSVWLRTKFLSSFKKKPPMILSYEECIFLLELCLEDINANNVNQLYDLPILPLCNGTFTTILCNKVETIHRVFFTTDDKFVNLLKTAPMTQKQEALQKQYDKLPKDAKQKHLKSQPMDNNISTRVIASDLPLTVTSKLSQEDIIKHTNIFAANIDTLIELLPSLLSKRCSTQMEVLWDDAPSLNLKVHEHASKKWLNDLWAYFKNEEDIMQRLEHLCIVPIISYLPNSHKCQKKLIRPNVESNIFIDVHQFDEPLKQLLYLIGFCCIDNQNIVNNVGASKYIFESDIIGILKGMDKLINTSFDGIATAFCAKMFKHCNKTQRRSLRQFIVRQIENLQYSDNNNERRKIISIFKGLIRALPIYEIYTAENEKTECFVSLNKDKKDLIWPPSEVNIHSFVNDPNNKNISISFLKVDYDKLLQFLDETQLSKSAFYDGYILPKMQEFSPQTRDAVVLSLLRNLESLKQTDGDFVSKLLKHPFLPTGPLSKLCRIENVYVPEPKLRRFLDEDVMPSPSFSAPDIIKILSRIGLKTSMDLDGILISASTIVKKLNEDKFDDNVLFAAKQRSEALLKYLDENWLSLKQAHTENALKEYLGDDEEKKSSDLLEEWNGFVEKLQHRIWVPIAPETPDPALYWKWKDAKQDIQKYFRTPLEIRLKKDAWFVSATYPTMSVDIKCEAFIKDMGWNKPLTMEIIGCQLREQGKYINDLKKRNRFQPQWEEQLMQQNKLFYAHLNGFLYDVEAKAVIGGNVNGLREIFKQSAVIFIDASTGYMPIDRVALNTNCDASPWLVTLNEELVKEFPYLFNECLQIKQQFEVNDYVIILKELYLKNKKRRLSENNLSKVLGILQYLGTYESALNDTSSSSSLHSSSSPSKSKSSNEIKQNEDDQNSESTEHQMVNHIDTTPIHIRFGPIYMPNVDGILCVSTDMVYNDAAWLQSSSSTKNLVFVHDKITESVARKLGVKSFRDVFASNKTPSTKYNCTGAYLIKKKLMIDKLGQRKKSEKEQKMEEEKKQNDVEQKVDDNKIDSDALIKNIILSMFEIADILESRHFEVSIDENEYRSQSVLNERLTKLQGRSLLFRFDKALPIDQILKLQQLWAFNTNSAVPALSKEKSLHFQQSGILPLYHLTDCLQIISGDRYILLDPADQFLQDSKLQNKPQFMNQFVQKVAQRKKAKSSPKQMKSKSPSQQKQKGKKFDMQENEMNEEKKNNDQKAESQRISFKSIDEDFTDNVRNELVGITGSARIFRYINTNSSKGIIQQFPDQFAPFIPFALKSNTPFPGTIIRVPLRTKEHLMSFQHLLTNMNENEDLEGSQQCHFSLSDFVCNGRKLRLIPLRIKNALTNCLIFGTHIEHVAISKVSKSAQGRDILYQSRIGASNTNEKQRNLRAKPWNSTTWKQKYSVSRLFGASKAKTYEYKLQITTQDSLIAYSKMMNEDKENTHKDALYERVLAKNGGNNVAALQITDNYLVCSNIGDGNSRDLAIGYNEKIENEMTKADDYRIPFCCVAAKLSGNIIQGRHVIDKYNGLKQVDDAYLFVNGVPAIKTNLPIHVNAMFRLTNQCRFDLFDATLLNTDIIRWNMELYRGGISTAYIQLLTQFAAHLTDNKRNKNVKDFAADRLYELWPNDWNALPLELRSIQRPFCAKASKAPLFLSPKKEFLEMDKSYFPSSSMSLIAAKFISRHCDVFSVPGYLVEQLRANTGSKISEFSPKDFRSLLHKRKSSLKSELDEITSKRSAYTNEELIALIFDLLEFCLNDLADNSSEIARLRSISLLPLAPSVGNNVKIVKFGSAQYVSASYKEQLLLPHFKGFIHPKVSQKPFAKFFCSDIFCRTVGLKLWNLEFVRNELPKLFKFQPRNFMIWKYEQTENPIFHSQQEQKQQQQQNEEEKKNEDVDKNKKEIKSLETKGNDNSDDYDYQSKHETVPYNLPNGAPHPKWIQLFWECVPISDQSKGTVKYFGNWPLLPLTNGNLCCVKFASKIALLCPEDNENKNEFLEKMRAILIEMNYPIIDWRFFPTKDSKKLIGKLSNIKHLTKTVLSNVNSLAPFMNGINDEMKLNDDNKRNLIEICAEALRQGQSFNAKMIENLKSLPVFERKENKNLNPNDGEGSSLFVRFDQNMKMLPATMDDPMYKLPARFLHFIMQNAVVLKYKFPELHKALGVEDMREESLIEKFVDEYMNNSVSMNNNGNELKIDKRTNCYQFQYEMISYLVRNWTLLEKKNNNLKPLLSKTPLIPIQNHEHLLMAPSELYDPSIPIFRKLFADDPVFPHSISSANCNWEKYKAWMRELGMNYEINGESMIKCAQKLESLSGVLSHAQMKDYEEKKQEIAMEAKYPRITSKEVIALSMELTSLLSSKFNEIFKADTFNKLSKIAFLPCKIPSIESNKNKNDANNISICRPLDALLEKDYLLSWTVSPVIICRMPEMGLQHLMIRSPPSIEVVIAHCIHLSQIKGGLDGWIYKDDPLQVFEKIIAFFYMKFQKNELTQTHINKLRNISFIPIGSNLLKASRLFMTMDGGDLSPFFFQIPRMFQSYEKLFNALGTQESPSIDDYHRFLVELHNENTKALNINELHAVFKVIELICKQIDGRGHSIEKLLVPSELGILTWSNQCVYNDDTYLSSRINRNKSNFCLVHSALKLSVCSKLKILPLSKAIVEQLNVCKIIKMPQNENVIMQYLNNANENNLCFNIERIIRHHILSTNNKYKYNKLNLPSKQMILRRLSKLKVELCSELNTKLMFNRSDVTSQRDKNKKNNVDFFFDQRKVILYLLWPVSNPMHCAIILSNCLCNLLNVYSPEMMTALCSVLYIPNVGVSKSENKSETLLDIMGISRIDRTQNGMLRGIPGAKIINDDLSFLQKQPLRKYLKNEIVAIQNPNNQTEKDLIYSVVLNVHQDSFGVLSKLKLKYNEDGSTKVFSSKDVYSFKSNLMHQSNDQNSQNRPSKMNIIRNVKDKLQKNDDDSNDNEQKDDLLNDDNDVNELMNTIDDMMNRAGLNKDKNQHQMMKENLTLRKNLENTSQSNKRLLHENNELKTDLENASNALMCRICQEKPVNRVLPSCGHLLCSQCLPKVRNQSCPFCRKKFDVSIPFRNPLEKHIKRMSK